MASDDADANAAINRMSDLAAALPEIDSDVINASLSQLPDELLISILEGLVSAADLLAARRVCRRWRSLVEEQQPAWRRIFCSMCPYSTAWAQHAPSDVSGGYLRCCERLGHQIRRLRKLWTEEYSNLFRFGKYSRWVVGCAEPGFVLPLLFATRICGLCLPDGFSQLDGAPERMYHPVHSTSSGSGGGGWSPEKLGDVSRLALDKSAMLALEIMQDAEHYDGRGTLDAGALKRVEKALSTWWGGEQRDRLLPRLFDADGFISLAEFVLADAEEQGADSRLNSVFWDSHGLTVRGIEYCQGQGAFHNPRQIPPLFNFAKLAEHVEQLRASKAYHAPLTE